MLNVTARVFDQTAVSYSLKARQTTKPYNGKELKNDQNGSTVCAEFERWQGNIY